MIFHNSFNSKFCHVYRLDIILCFLTVSLIQASKEILNDAESTRFTPEFTHVGQAVREEQQQYMKNGIHLNTLLET